MPVYWVVEFSFTNTNSMIVHRLCPSLGQSVFHNPRTLGDCRHTLRTVAKPTAFVWQRSAERISYTDQVNHPGYSCLMNRAGLPAHSWLSGTLPVTTDPAPIIEFLPMTVPFRIMLEAPMNAFSLIVTGAVRVPCLSEPGFFRASGSELWKSVSIM